MKMQMIEVPVKKIFVDSDTAVRNGIYEFTIDCGAVYFGAVYDGDGQLTAIDQYFYTEEASHDDMAEAAGDNQLLNVDSKDYWAKTYLLTKEEKDQEWLRFHAVVPQTIDPDYFYQKYIGE